MPGSYQHGVIHPLQSAAGASAKDAMAFIHNVKRTHVELYRHVAIDKAVHAVHEIAFDEPCVIGVKIRQMSACSSDLREPTLSQTSQWQLQCRQRFQQRYQQQSWRCRQHRVGH
jgi:hypothetical protein